jgi:predicted aspartyl protease
MKYAYNLTYRPAFPAIEIILHNRYDELRSEAVQALLDTGADGSMIPLALLQEILAPPLAEARIRSHWGEWRYVQQFAVEIELVGMNIKIPNLFVVDDDLGDEIILGRDFINKLRLQLDGPANQTTIPKQ